MKDLANRYTYNIDFSIDENKKIISHNSKLKADRGPRLYNTKLDVEDLPEYYCDVQRYGGCHDVIKSTGIKDLKYSWVKENHFMKDSVLKVSYTGEICEKQTNSFFKDYTNVDVMVFGTSILKFLAYVKSYSNYDISHIKSEFIRHCEWLKEHEPAFAPDTDDFSKWFDNKINEYICQ